MEVSTLHPITPSTAEFKRFVCLDSSLQDSIGDHIQHPEGGYIFYDGCIVSPHPLSKTHISAANWVLNSLAEGKDDITVVIDARKLTVNYYAVSHSSKRIIWAPEHVIGGIRQDLEYWVHMRNFPAPRFSTSDDISEFQRVLGNNMLHAMYPSSKPEILYLLPSQIITRLDNLKLESSKKDTYYGTFRIAGFWVSIINNRATELPEHKSLKAGQFDIDIVQKRFQEWWSGHPDNQHFTVNAEIDDLDGADNNYQPGVIQVVQLELRTPTSPTHRISTRLKMSTDEVLELLRKHGCEDVTAQLIGSPLNTDPIQGGGFGEVYRGALDCGTEVSLKGLRPVIDSSDNGRGLVKLAAHELYIWSKCDHINILNLIGVAKLKEQLFMVSPWMVNGNVRDYLTGKSQEVRYQTCRQISDGVAYLHHRGIVHGDLKCHNIVVSKDGTPKITDFGTATVNEYSLCFTKSGMETNVTFRWAAPEILQHQTKSTAQSDVYSLGMTILEAFTGVVPYNGIFNIAHVYMRIVRGEKPKRASIWDDGKAGLLWNLLVDCWAYDPPERPNAVSVRDQIEGISSMVGLH
ncbi:Proto-oncogene tyrosine-protein kinase ROS [Rhizoctonia solani]|uniref:Proto-oncogene tyrosine-protein kinase ROS n=1 Tax=Rhizoctonia solani TaxID=456999 RepID=A0A0K6G7E9_9AGAM|nr:unnamed protein product [Rhizoctonia solani]CUA74537.1 Proto-oncogene tyrosine-protein kinase ROS [Rhizoctonia solani]